MKKDNTDNNESTIPNNNEPSFKKMILLVGTTGIGFTEILDHVKKALGQEYSGCIAKFEDYLKLSGLCYNIADLVTLLQFTGQEAEEAFNEAVDRLANSMKEKGCRDIIVVAAHLTYMTGGEPSTIPNPALNLLMQLAEKTIIVHVVEDWYDAIKRIAERGRKRRKKSICKSESSGFNIEPEILLAWRQTDLNVVQTLLKFTPTSGWFLLANKHSEETIIKFIKYLAYNYDPGSPRPLDYVLAYISHPISDLRRYHHNIRAIIRYLAKHQDNTPKNIALPPLGLNPLILIIEGAKEFIKNNFWRFSYYCNNKKTEIIFFEPTTIDELLYDNFIKTIKEGESKEEYDFESKSVPPPLFIPSLRWPWRYSLREKYSWWYEDWACKMEQADILKKDLAFTFKADIGNLINALKSELEETPDKGAEKGSDSCEGEDCLLKSILYIYNSRIKSIIRSQIEMRDFIYVNQSDLLIAIIPAIIYQTSKSRELQVLLIESGGVTNEVLRAFSLGKQITVLIVPITGKSILRAAEHLIDIYVKEYDMNKKEKIVSKIIIQGLMKNKIGNIDEIRNMNEDGINPDTIATRLQSDIASGGPFLLLPRQAKILTLPPITSKDIDDIINEIKKNIKEDRDKNSNKDTSHGCFELSIYEYLARKIADKLEKEKDKIRVLTGDP